MEQAITWIMEHESDPDLDQPLLLPEVALQLPAFCELHFTDDQGNPADAPQHEA